MRSRLIFLFVVIKVVPLVLLAFIAARHADDLGLELGQSAQQMAKTAKRALTNTADMAVADSVRALDERAREDIERLTTDTARQVAAFLYDRDGDIRLAASLPPDEASYRAFLENRTGFVVETGAWEFDPSRNAWKRSGPPGPEPEAIPFTLIDNAHGFHYRPPDDFIRHRKPLYLEMSFVDSSGRERVKVTTSPKVSAEKKDVGRPENTFARSERYMPELLRLQPGQIYVSEVIGEYVGSKVVGPYTPAAAKAAGEDFDPEKSAFAGKENPVGRRFAGIIRWASPVVKDGRVAGYVTLALDHDHIMEFTNHIMPTPRRYTDIPDASEGNYAFIWDHVGRNIVHPRHYFIAGYDPKSGKPQIPWLEDAIHEAWTQSGKTYEDFIKDVPTFQKQGLDKRGSRALVEAGLQGLDCRYLNFAPQCTGWYEVTKNGGSGSFVILWSGLWKLTTAAAIPYYTGQYGATPRGFGVVTIGANVDEFHAAANETKKAIDQQIQNTDRDLRFVEKKTHEAIKAMLFDASMNLTASTVVMSLAVIFIAIWLASALTKRITTLIMGLSRFRSGERGFRFRTTQTDEMGALADSFDALADTLDAHLSRLEEEIAERQRFEAELLAMKGGLEELVDSRTSDLSELNARLSSQIEERRQAEAKVRHLAHHDPLTCLHNRRYFQDKLDEAVDRAREEGGQVALLYCDLNLFQKVNDSFGHAVGDELLRTVAERLTANLSGQDLVARLGGDEFAVLLHDTPSVKNIEQIALRLIRVTAEPMNAQGHKVIVGISIGISLFPDNSLDSGQMLMHADLAMYKAKTEGGNRFAHFSPKMRHSLLERAQWELELREALRLEQFLLHYQPRFDVKRRRIVGLEALLRWQHPQRGLLAPAVFLDVATQSGLMPAIDDWVLGRACRQARAFDELGFTYARMAVNVSAKEVVKHGFAAKVVQAAEHAGLPPSRLGLEITEHALIEDYHAAVANLQGLREQKVQIAIDDFGVAHSSLQRLIECPIDMIKIDRFFVSRIGVSAKSEAVIQAVGVMARQTGLAVVAEGVETPAQLAFLEECGCRLIQGYLFAKPMSAEDLLTWQPPEIKE